MPDSQFPHLNLVYKDRGTAHLEGGASSNPDVERNQEDRPQHSQFLKSKISGFSNKAKEMRESREQSDLPKIKGGVSFLLKIPDEDDGTIEFVSEKLGLEIVAEYEDGFLIVSTDDLELDSVKDLADNFASDSKKVRHGSGNMARILDIDEDPLSENRIRRILEDRLFERWPFSDEEDLTLDISIEVAAFGQPPKPRLGKNLKPETRVRNQEEYDNNKREFFEGLDERRRIRESEIENFVTHYQGEICSITDDSHVVEFPDSFSARVRMTGKGFKDLICNYPNLFEVTIPDEIKPFKIIPEKDEIFETNFELLAPKKESPSICVIDSGVQENHRWLAAAVVKKFSRCFIPGVDVNDVADYVRGGGHGTRVAGACLYSDSIVKEDSFEAPFWLLNARILDENNELLAKIFPAEMLYQIVSYYKEKCGTRIFQHSVGSNWCCRLSRMSIWASAIDLISYTSDILLIQSAGNLNVHGGAANPGILDHLNRGRTYPEYLYESSSRISNPAQSLQALTVGSISSEFYQDGNKQSVSPEMHPSSFSRSGFGMWDSIKPEVVEFGGDDVIINGTAPTLTTPPEVCPELIRSTLNGGPAYDKDEIGTSFSAPKVAHIAGHLESILPEHNALLYRALIVNSARWPEWAEQLDINRRVPVIRSIGYGVPNLSRAVENSNNRITLITEEAYAIKAKEGFIFGIPLPEEIRRPGSDFQVRIEVTLSYSGLPRRTRKSRRGYLGVWLDWKASRKKESFKAFRARALKDADDVESDDDGNFMWTLGNKKDNNGQTKGVSRCNGTIQKDWTIGNSYDLPDVFGVVIRGHEGWDRKNQDSTSQFALVVSFEVLGAEINIYDEIRNAVEQEIQERARVEAQAL